MAQIVMTEAPGGFGDAYQCPFCGRMTLAKETGEDGMPTSVDVDAPSKCKRCGSPMDIDAAHKYEEDMAAAAAKTPERAAARRRVVKV